MNLEDISKVKWTMAAIQMEAEGEDDYLFIYDVDSIRATDFMGKIRVDKSFFDEILERGIWDDCILDGISEGKIALVRVCSKPLVVYEEVPEYDYWVELLLYHYIMEYVQNGKLSKLLIVEHRKEDQQKN